MGRPDVGVPLVGAQALGTHAAGALMAVRGHVPQKPSLAELNTQALAGDADAALRLADLSAACKDVTEFLDRFVPAEDLAACFDVYCDAFQKSRARALIDTLELPIVQKTNLGERIP